MFHIYKFFRRRAAAAAPLDGPASVWPSIVNRWAGWLASEAQATPRVITVLHATRPNTLYTDACESGMGAILFHTDGLVSIWARPFVGEERQHHINVKEAIALHDALAAMDWSGTIHVFIDNTTVLYTTDKGYSRSFDMNTQVGRIRRLAKWRSVLSVTYVKSECNKADWLSRLFE